MSSTKELGSTKLDVATLPQPPRSSDLDQSSADFGGEIFWNKVNNAQLTFEEFEVLDRKQRSEVFMVQQGIISDLMGKVVALEKQFEDQNDKITKLQSSSVGINSKKSLKKSNSFNKSKATNEKKWSGKKKAFYAALAAVALVGTVYVAGIFDRNNEGIDETDEAARNGGEQTEQVADADNDFDFFDHPGVQTTDAMSTDNDSAPATDTVISPEEAIRNQFSAFGDNIAIGDDVNFALNPHESGASAFRNTTITSIEELFAWLNSGDAKANAALAADSAFLAENPELAERYYNGEALHFVQFNEAAEIFGNDFYHNGQSVESEGARSVAAGDVWIIYVDEDGNVVKELSRRADCGNGTFDQIVPAIPGSRPSTPIDAPVTPGNPTPETPEPETPTPNNPVTPGNPTPETPEPETPTPNTPEEPETPDCEDTHGEGAEICNPPEEEEKDPLTQDEAIVSAAINTEQAHPAPTPGYVPGSTEEIVDQQDANDAAIQAGGDTLDPELNVGGSTEGAAPGEESQQTGGANQNPDLLPGDDAPANPQNDGTPPSQGSNGGVVNSPEAPVATIDAPGVIDVPADSSTVNTPADGGGSGSPG